jgi:hypothetical protein
MKFTVQFNASKNALEKFCSKQIEMQSVNSLFICLIRKLMKALVVFESKYLQEHFCIQLFLQRSSFAKLPADFFCLFAAVF